MANRIVGHIRTNVIGYLALVLAMSSTAYAVEANSIGAHQLKKNSVGSSELKTGAVGADEIDDGLCGFVGQILLLGFDDFAPTGTLAANGQLLSISENPALFSFYGTKYGGDGSKTFGLPKLNGPANGTQYVVCVDGSFPKQP